MQMEFRPMQLLLRLEYTALFLFFSYLAVTQLEFLVFLLAMLAPDLGMLGYLVNPKVGAITYNLTHHHAVGVVLIFTGFILVNPTFTIAGYILLAHSFLDRMLGLGLKFTDEFKHTHLS